MINLLSLHVIMLMVAGGMTQGRVMLCVDEPGVASSVMLLVNIMEPNFHCIVKSIILSDQQFMYFLSHNRFINIVPTQTTLIYQNRALL